MNTIIFYFRNDTIPNPCKVVFIFFGILPFLGRVFFNIAGLTCYKFDHPIKRCAEYIDVTRMSKIPAIGYRLLRMLNVHPEPKRPRCRR